MVFVLVSFLGCTKRDSEINFEKIDPRKEIATNVELIYSDSAITKFKIISPIRESFNEESKFVEEYPKGLYIEFYDKNKKVISSMRAKYARRVSEDGQMTLRDSVVLMNHQGDKLSTRGILWDEQNHILHTTKFVQLVRVNAQDTFYGFGFHAKDDFSKFNIIQLTGKRRYQDLTKELVDE